jgi:hypothetical protein
MNIGQRLRVNLALAAIGEQTCVDEAFIMQDSQRFQRPLSNILNFRTPEALCIGSLEDIVVQVSQNKTGGAVSGGNLVKQRANKCCSVLEAK